MLLPDYIRHYLSLPGLLFFLLVSLAVVILIHAILLTAARKQAMHYLRSDRAVAITDLFNRYTERYYELMLSATSTLFFTGIFFLIDFDYFSVSAGAWQFWENYRDFILLAFIIVSIILISIVDHFFIPLRIIEKEEKSTLRLAGMLYMLVIFAYIKFIYLDDNYDAILFYFITMILGRFVYLDASFKDFCISMKALASQLPILLLVLLSTALLALYGFKSGYLLTANGVVVSMFLAHFFVILEIYLITRVSLPQKIAERIAGRL